MDPIIADLTITAESIHIHDSMATFTIQAAPETTTLLPINPATGHHFTDDEAAIHRAIAPDIGDPPSAERPMRNLCRNDDDDDNFGGRRGGPPGGGGGPPQGPPQGGGRGGGGPPQGNSGLPQQVHPLTEKFVGNAPIIFTGDRGKTEQFLTQWELYWGVNNNNSLMRNAYTRSMLFLTYIQGNIVNEWIVAMSRWLNCQIAGGIHDDNEDLWRVVDDAFRHRFSNTLERETAQAELKKGIKMKDGDIDAYVTTFEQLARKAGYPLDSDLTLDFFTDGLPRELYEKVYQFDMPCNYEEWKRATMCRQEQYIRMRGRINQHHGTTPMCATPFRGGGGAGWFPPHNLNHFSRHPNTMDTSADRTQVRLANMEEVLNQCHPNQTDPRNPFFRPRGGAIAQTADKMGRRDFREVTCYSCGKKGHISRQCYQRNGPPPANRPSTSSSRMLETDYQEQEVLVARTDARPLQQRASDWLHGVAGEDDEVKDLILKDLWMKEGFQSA